MINKATLIGRLGKDSETKTIKDKTLIRFSVATSETWKDNQGEKQEKTEWHNVGYWAKSAKLAEYLLKGALVYVEGKIETKEHEGKYYTGIVASQVKVLEFPQKETTGANNASVQNNSDSLPF